MEEENVILCKTQRGSVHLLHVSNVCHYQSSINPTIIIIYVIWYICYQSSSIMYSRTCAAYVLNNLKYLYAFPVVCILCFFSNLLNVYLTLLYNIKKKICALRHKQT